MSMMNKSKILFCNFKLDLVILNDRKNRNNNLHEIFYHIAFSRHDRTAECLHADVVISDVSVSNLDRGPKFRFLTTNLKFCVTPYLRTQRLREMRKSRIKHKIEGQRKRKLIFKKFCLGWYEYLGFIWSHNNFGAGETCLGRLT
jgi:hypothetical protein